MSLLPLFEWCEASAIGEAIRDSSWLFPVIEAVHLVAFAVIGGALLVVDLRLLGLHPQWSAPRPLARAVQPWLLGSLAIMIPTGALLFLAEAIKCYYSIPFWIKMSSLTLALLVMFTVRRRVIAAEPGTRAARWARAVGGVSILLWSGVAWGGRWIGFSG